MAMPRAKMRSKSTAKNKSVTKNKSTTKKKAGSKTKSVLSNLFLLRTQPKKNFSTHFEYGNVAIDLKSTVKGSVIKLDVKISSKNFNFSGTLSLNERAFSELEHLFDHLKSGIRKIR